MLEIAHFGVEHRVARLQAIVYLPLRVELAIELSNLEPAALARPDRILQGDDKNGQDQRENSQGGQLMRVGGKRGARDSLQRHRDLPRCAAAGCTCRSDRSAKASRS